MKQSSRTVTARIHRLAGQLNAIETMLQNRRTCTEVLNQISAVRAGLEQVAAIVFQTELQKLSAKKKLTALDVEKITQAFSKTT
jgi:DNA-binding FrmR family transcriptional regulator